MIQIQAPPNIVEVSIGRTIHETKARIFLKIYAEVEIH